MKQEISSETALQLRDNAKFQLQQIKSLESGIEYLNKVKAIEVWAKAEKIDAELQNIVSEQKIRTQRILGNLIKEGQQRGEIASKDSGGRGANQHAGMPDGNTSKTPKSSKSSKQKTAGASKKEPKTKPKTLEEVGLNAKQSHLFKKVAAIPEKKFESIIAEKKKSDDPKSSEITTMGVLKAAKGAHVSHNSGDSEWYTPEKYIESAKTVMGKIDLDPASSDIANKVIKAEKFYTIKNDGLTKSWTGCIWMNPPYAQPLISKFSEKLCEEIKNKKVEEAIVLVNNATETSWFQEMAKLSSAICFPKSRIKFWAPDKISAPLQGQAFLYFGKKLDEFKNEFKKFGVVLIHV